MRDDSWWLLSHHTMPRGRKSGLPYSLKGRRQPSFGPSLHWVIKMSHNLKSRLLKAPVPCHPPRKLQYEMNFFELCLRPAWVGSTSLVCLLRVGNTPTSHQPLSAQLPNLSVRILWPVGNSWVLMASWLPRTACPPEHILLVEEKETKSGLRIRNGVPPMSLNFPGVLSLCFHPKREGEVILAPQEKKKMHTQHKRPGPPPITAGQ